MGSDLWLAVWIGLGVAFYALAGRSFWNRWLCVAVAVLLLPSAASAVDSAPVCAVTWTLQPSWHQDPGGNPVQIPAGTLAGGTAYFQAGQPFNYGSGIGVVGGNPSSNALAVIGLVMADFGTYYVGQANVWGKWVTNPDPNYNVGAMVATESHSLTVIYEYDDNANASVSVLWDGQVVATPHSPQGDFVGNWHWCMANPVGAGGYSSDRVGSNGNDAAFGANTSAVGVNFGNGLPVKASNKGGVATSQPSTTQAAPTSYPATTQASWVQQFESQVTAPGSGIWDQTTAYVSSKAFKDQYRTGISADVFSSYTPDVRWEQASADIASMIEWAVPGSTTFDTAKKSVVFNHYFDSGNGMIQVFCKAWSDTVANYSGIFGFLRTLVDLGLIFGVTINTFRHIVKGLGMRNAEDVELPGVEENAVFALQED